MRFFSVEKLRQFYTLHTHIAIVFLTLFLTTFGVIITYTHHENSKSIVSLSEMVLHRTGEGIIQKIHHNLELAQIFSYLGDQCINAENEVTLQNESVIGPMRAMLANNPFVTRVMVGLKSGNYLEIRRVDRGDVYLTKHAERVPSDTKFIIKFLKKTEKTFEAIQMYENHIGKIVATETLNNASESDHKNQSWYKEAAYNKTVYWGDLHLHQDGHDACFIVSNIIQNNNTDEFLGVFGLDMHTAEISDFLKESKIGDDSSLFVVDVDGEVVAHSSPQLVRVNKVTSGEIAHMVTYKEINDSPLKRAYSLYLRDKNKCTFSFNMDGRAYMTTFVKFLRIVTKETEERIGVGDFENYWVLGIVVPSDEFLGAIWQMETNVLIITFVLGLLSIIIMLILAHRVAKPIVMLADEADKIKNFDLTNPIVPKSIVHEIYILGGAITSMNYSMRAFSKFIPKILVGKLLKNGKDIKIGGKEARTTFLFSDVVGFTTISEDYPPDKLVQHLSEYFEEVSTIIFRYQGIIDKYIGDGIMALWGAPVKDKEQVLHACKSAVAIQKKLIVLNEQWQAEGKPPLFTRIGIHAGDVIVGNMGSSDRINYTALGDPVNIASRLEGVNRLYGTSIIVSKEVALELGSKAYVRPVDIVAVKGRTEGIEIFELIGINDGDPTLLPSKKKLEFAKNFAEGYRLYRQRMWKEALQIFEMIYEESAGDLSVSIYVARCKELIANPPGEEWNGVFILSEK